MSGSARPPLTSLTTVAPAAKAAWATSVRMVSTLTSTFSRARAVITGITRSSSSSAGIRWAPGRVDSPPTSTRSAPSATSCRPRAMAASAPNHAPPSENESGVTFTTPMIRHRPGSGRPGGLGPRRRPASQAGPAGVPAGVPLVTRVTLCAKTRCGAETAQHGPAAGPGSAGGRSWRALALAAKRARPAGEPQAAGDPAHLYGGPDQERFGFQRGEGDPGRVPGPGEHEETRHPERAELGVELVQRFDLEPAGGEQQDAPPGAEHRPGADPLAPGQRRAEHREVERHPLDAEFLGRLDRLHDEEVVDPWLRGAFPAHEVQGQAVGTPRHEVQQAAQHPVFHGGGDHALPVARPADAAQGHREPALGGAATPGVGPANQPLDLLGRNLAEPP